MKVTFESNKDGESMHYFVEAKEGNFSVCIDVYGKPDESKPVAEALRECLKVALKKRK